MLSVVAFGAIVIGQTLQPAPQIVNQKASLNQVYEQSYVQAKTMLPNIIATKFSGNWQKASINSPAILAAIETTTVGQTQKFGDSLYLGDVRHQVESAFSAALKDLRSDQGHQTNR
jgi:dihydroorotate dehydrogenase